MSIDMLNFEAVKAGIENLTKQLCEKDRTDELWDENFIDKTRPYYKIGCWQSRYQSLADATRLSIETITAIKADWEDGSTNSSEDALNSIWTFDEKQGETEDYVEGIVQGLKIALDSLTSRIK